MRIGEKTDTGKQRAINEDSYFVYKNANLLGGMVADGMGGENAGEVASAMATRTVKEFIMNEFDPEMDYMEMGELIKRAFIEANKRIYRYAKGNPELEGMGTTATLAMIYKNKLITVHVGDSRVYTIDNEKIKQISTDHSFVQELLARGEITKEFAEHHPAKNYITRAVGTEDILKVDVLVKDYSGDTVLVCSDGLTNMLSDSQIMEMVNEHDDLQEAADALTAFANKKGGLDNITVLIFSKE